MTGILASGSNLHLDRVPVPAQLWLQIFLIAAGVGWLGYRLVNGFAGVVAAAIYLSAHFINWANADSYFSTAGTLVFILAVIPLHKVTMNLLGIALLLFFLGSDLMVNWERFRGPAQWDLLGIGLLSFLIFLAEVCRLFRSKALKAATSLDIPATKGTGAPKNPVFSGILVVGLGIVTSWLLWKGLQPNPQLAFGLCLSALVVLAWAGKGLRTMLLPVVAVLGSAALFSPELTDLVAPSFSAFSKNVAKGVPEMLAIPIAFGITLAAVAAGRKYWSAIAFSIALAMAVHPVHPDLAVTFRALIFASVIVAVGDRLISGWRPALQAPPRPSPAPGSLPHP